MIKRYYFMSAKKPHCDGSGSYSWDCITAHYISFFPDPDKIYKEMADCLAKNMIKESGDKLMITAFNRI